MNPRSALCHPQVLWAAWLRVDGWYRTGNMAPQPELARWRLHPEKELRKLRSELEDDTWRPSRWRQVPYPKKGACLRHYVMPTVRDQVALMAYMVLLAPVLDRGFQHFSFGNRWYRPMFWDRRSSPPHWVHLPYPLLTSRIYRPYAQSYGLFRRVAHWTVASMTDTPISARDYSGLVQQPKDYSDILPPWTESDWWSSSTERRACWIALDLQLAYPSVCLVELRECLMRLVARNDSGIPMDPPSEVVSGYPDQVLRVLDDPDGRSALAENFMANLMRIDFDAGSIRPESWTPFHARPQLPPDKDNGIPTGLAISGILLNVVLDRADDHLLHFLTSATERRGAVVRFADDVYLLSSTYDGLFELTEVFWQALSQNNSASLATPVSQTNLYLNLTKVRPDAVRSTIRRFLKSQKWKKCVEDGCDELMPPSDTDKEYVTLSGWWRDSKASDRTVALQAGLDRATITSSDLGPFMTALVERLSEIGTDTLADRFGPDATNRLERLHELARFDIEDEQVRTDTRRAFAVNRLVQAWLPSSGASDAIREIRRSVEHVLQLTPWKHALWRAVVRAAARRPLGDRSKSERSTDDKEAAAWLKVQLRRIARAEKGREEPESWARTWPEECEDIGHGHGNDWKEEYLSFHRTTFWYALSQTLIGLWWHIDRGSQPAYAGPLPDWWTTRAVPEGSHKRMIGFLGAADEWAGVLYPDALGQPRMPWWELDQMCAAVLASVSRSATVRGLRSCKRAKGVLSVPSSLGRSKNPRIVKILEANGRLLPQHEKNRKKKPLLGTSDLAHVVLAGKDRGVGKLLFPRSGKPLVKAPDSRHAVMACIYLDCQDYLKTDVLYSLVDTMDRPARVLGADPMALSEYHRLRRIVMGRPRR